MDISQYFHQVLVDEHDADVFRYFWFRDQQMNSYKTLRFNAHIFGSGASSLVTSFVLRYHAEKIKHLFPENVNDTIRNQFYVDDVSAGADSVDRALELKENLKTAIGMGGFDLAKWKRSHPRILEGEEIPKQKIIGSDGEESTKVLKVEWRMEEDVFTFNFDDESLQREVKTPRDIVSI